MVLRLLNRFTFLSTSPSPYLVVSPEVSLTLLAPWTPSCEVEDAPGTEGNAEQIINAQF